MSDATPRFTLTDEQRTLLEEMEALREECRQTQDAFAKKFGYTGSSWSRMTKALASDSKGHYFELVEDASRVFAQLQIAHRRLRQEAARTRAQRTRPIVKTNLFQVIIEELAIAEKKTDEKRAVVYLAPFGGGKSKLIELLVRDHGARAVETRSTWERSYRTCLTDTGAALGLVFDYTASISFMENAIFDALKTPQVLCFDEAEFFGKDSLNFLKWLLNRTPVVPMFCASQESLDRWLKRYPHEAAQLQRRFHYVVPMLCVDPKEDVPLFATAAGVTVGESQAALLSNAANEFGAYSTLAEVLGDLKKQGHAKPSCDEVTAAIDNLFGRQRRARVQRKESGR